MKKKIRKGLSNGKCFIKYVYLSTSIKINKKNILILNIPEHGNLGDQAIVQGEEKFLNKYFSGHKVYKISATDWYKGVSTFIKKTGVSLSKKNFDYIFIHGGGFLGDLWPREILLITEMMAVFNGAKFIMFPQTCFYQSEQNLLKDIDNEHSLYRNDKILFFAREKNTYNLLTQRLQVPPNRCKLIPDIVTFLKRDNIIKKRKNILLCIRNDREKDFDTKYLENELKELKTPYYYTDTVLPNRRSVRNDKERNYELNKIFDEFSGSKLVITDRLHGMIFAAITGTPCLAVNNLSKKVSAVYEWIEYLPYIKCIETGHIEKKEIQEALAFPVQKYDNSPLQPYFDEMAKSIKEF